MVVAIESIPNSPYLSIRIILGTLDWMIFIGYIRCESSRI